MTRTGHGSYRLASNHPGTHTPELTQESFEWEGFIVSVVLRPRDGRKVVTELHIVPTDGQSPPPLSSTMLRALPLGQLREHALEIEAVGDARSLHGRVRRDERFYAEVAAAYVDLLNVNTSRPAEAMAHTVEVPVRTVHAWLHKARTRGLLTSAGAGQAGGELTEQARRLLNNDNSNGGH